MDLHDRIELTSCSLSDLEKCAGHYNVPNTVENVSRILNAAFQNLVPPGDKFTDFVVVFSDPDNPSSIIVTPKADAPRCIVDILSRYADAVES